MPLLQADDLEPNTFITVHSYRQAPFGVFPGPLVPPPGHVLFITTINLPWVLCISIAPTGSKMPMYVDTRICNLMRLPDDHVIDILLPSALACDPPHPLPQKPSGVQPPAPASFPASLRELLPPH